MASCFEGSHLLINVSHFIADCISRIYVRTFIGRRFWVRKCFGLMHCLNSLRDNHTVHSLRTSRTDFFYASVITCCFSGLSNPVDPRLVDSKSLQFDIFGTLCFCFHGHIRGWATRWSAEKMLDGKHQRVNMSALARTAHKVLLQKDAPRVSRRPVGQGTEVCLFI